MKLMEGEECAELLLLAESEIMQFEKQAATYKNLEQSLRAQLILSEQANQYRIADNDILKGEVKKWKRRNAGTVILCGIITGLTLFVAIR